MPFGRVNNKMSHKKYSMSITEEERQWFHELAKAERKSIPIMIIECFRNKSRKLKISLPEEIIPDNKRIYRKEDHKFTYKEMYLKDLLENSIQINSRL